ncbi:tubulin-specific chaperone E [Myriangium duriaei CBS 260.36]|uniref:Tubulin-specific chaperone E n=1 Tax=Myriangium duriaei CBS 260.36 TaxID=1168546 RepID=A0A9P4J8Y5_9PEZI|nr:tubulin-specific chaperone E [Myriangium duriaei CBS 260.36]
MTKFYAGRRLSLKGEACTVRYVGEVNGKKGQWLGVEWDDPSRGKHDGNFEGRRYFSCKSSSSQCASFLRPDAKFDATKTVKQAVTEKYAPTDDLNAMAAVKISGKTVEETGYNKILLRQSKLGSLANVILDGQSLTAPDDGERHDLALLCPKAVLVDLGWNLFETFDQIRHALGGLASLRSLSLEGNRLHSFDCDESFEYVTNLNLDHMLLSPEQLHSILSNFPLLRQLSVSTNLLFQPGSCQMPTDLTELQLNNNGLTDLVSMIPWLSRCKELIKLGLKNNKISSVREGSQGQGAISKFQKCIKEVDLAFNAISSWTFFDTITILIPGLQHLRISGNPIYEASTRPNGKLLDQTQVSMIIIARVPQLQTLNFTAIADKDRLNAETFYLSLIAEELSNAPAADEDEILARHPRFGDLCEEYGPPTVTREGEQIIDPNSIAAHLINCRVFFVQPLEGANLPTKDSSQVIEIPQSFSIYSVYGLVARRFELMPSSLRLIWETGERDPPDRGMPTHAAVIEEWDSEDEDEGPDADDWVDREVELVRGTRPLGTVVEAKDALIRIEFDPRAQDILVSDFLARRKT